MRNLLLTLFQVIFSPEDLAQLVERDATGTCKLAALQPSTAAAVVALDAGAFLAVTPLPEGSSSGGGGGVEKLLVTCWRGRGEASVNVMCSKESLHVVAHRLADLGVAVAIPHLGTPKTTKTLEEAEAKAAQAKEAAHAAVATDARAEK
jgi:hypothetical protein